MISIQINPNLRVEDGCTIADLDEDVHGGSLDQLSPGLEVTVYEPVSGLVGPGWIMEVDIEERAVVVKVEWGRLHLNVNATQAGAYVPMPNLRSLVPVAHVA